MSHFHKFLEIYIGRRIVGVIEERDPADPSTIIYTYEISDIEIPFDEAGISQDAILEDMEINQNICYVNKYEEQYYYKDRFMRENFNAQYAAMLWYLQDAFAADPAD